MRFQPILAGLVYGLLSVSSQAAPFNPDTRSVSLNERADKASVTSDWVFDGVDYEKKGKELLSKGEAAYANGHSNDHDYTNVIKHYNVKKQKKTNPQVDLDAQKWISKVANIPIPKNPAIQGGFNVFDKYTLYGYKEEEECHNTVCVVEVFISAKYKTMMPSRLFSKEAPGKPESLYSKDLPVGKRLPMSEILFQCWKTTVEEYNKSEEGKETPVKISDLKHIIGVDVDNETAKKIVEKAKEAKKATTPEFDLKHTDGAPYNAMAYSSSGVSKVWMLADHAIASEFNGLKLHDISVSTVDQRPMIAWELGH